MDNANRYAYRDILYLATCESRAIINMVCHSTVLFNPFRWHFAYRQLCRIYALADWMRSVAKFSSLEFAGFDEERFWRKYDEIVKSYFELQMYKRRFSKACTKYSPPEGVA